MEIEESQLRGNNAVWAGAFQLAYCATVHPRSLEGTLFMMMMMMMIIMIHILCVCVCVCMYVCVYIYIYIYIYIHTHTRCMHK
jgi:hypothetical protein